MKTQALELLIQSLELLAQRSELELEIETDSCEGVTRLHIATSDERKATITHNGRFDQYWISLGGKRSQPIALSRVLPVVSDYCH